MTGPMPDYSPETLTAAAVAIHDVDCPDTHCSDAALGHCYRLAEAALAAVVPAIRAHIYAELGNDHFVVFTEDRWIVEHSVECRLGGHMPECEYHAAVARIAGEFVPGMAGRWLITAIDLNGEPALVRDDLLRKDTST